METPGRTFKKHNSWVLQSEVLTYSMWSKFLKPPSYPNGQQSSETTGLNKRESRDVTLQDLPRTAPALVSSGAQPPPGTSFFPSSVGAFDPQLAPPEVARCPPQLQTSHADSTISNNTSLLSSTRNFSWKPFPSSLTVQGNRRVTND